jgi:hypothetical protein
VAGRETYHHRLAHNLLAMISSDPKSEKSRGARQYISYIAKMYISRKSGGEGGRLMITIHIVFRTTWILACRRASTVFG